MKRLLRLSRPAEVAQAIRRDIAPLAPPPPLRIGTSDRLHFRFDAVYRRVGNGFEIELPAFPTDGHPYDKAAHFGPAYLYWLMHCPAEVAQISVTHCDGDHPGNALFSPSTNRADQVAIPDLYFFRERGFAAMRALAEDNATAWSARSGDIVWRGAANGAGSCDPQMAAAAPAGALPRLLLCLAARAISDADVALADYRGDQMTVETLRRQDILRDPIPEASWLGRKFAIDIDGHSNTWSNLFVRLLFGCCVLKVESRLGFRQWYYGDIRPWEHYVPVRADLADLAEKVDWVRGNDRRAAEIAANGRHFAHSLTWEAGRRQAVDLIAANWRRDDPYRFGPRGPDQPSNVTVTPR